jgi:hypothetical protein
VLVRPLLFLPLSLLPSSPPFLSSPTSPPHKKTWRPNADCVAVEAKKDAPIKGLQRSNSEMEMIAEKAALLSTHEEDEIPRLTSDQLSPMEERDPGLSIITPGENNVDPLANSTSTKMSEKARGKMRAVDPTSQETEEIDVGDEELLGIAAAGVGPSGYVPTQEWVSSWQKGYVRSPSLFLISASPSPSRSLLLFHRHIPSAIYFCTLYPDLPSP